jgi:hypothetical protein
VDGSCSLSMALGSAVAVPEAAAGAAAVPAIPPLLPIAEPRGGRTTGIEGENKVDQRDLLPLHLAYDDQRADGRASRQVSLSDCGG